MEEIKVLTQNRVTFYLSFKRLFDVLASFLLLIFFTPLILVIALIIRLKKNQRIIFKQTRIGLNGKAFSIIKFCTMIDNAETVLKQNEELYKKFVHNGYKLDEGEDPRITKIGLFLRKTSIDELPQLFNVLKGDMSLVGPRPVVHAELVEYVGDEKDLFLSAKPGITGHWQVSGRSRVGYPERKDLELYYAKNKSLFFDMKILYKTVGAVLLRNGAY